MFLSFFNVSVFSYVDLIWYLVHGPVVKPVTSPAVITVPDQTTKSLFALIIGINAYKHENILDGCIKDATAVRDYLLQDLKVPSSHIRFLTDANATRADIIKGFLEIQTDKRIKKNDPILIYFAGHGHETDAPEGWPSGDVSDKIQMLIPQDYCPIPGREVHGIPDQTLAALLNGIAIKHGDNITVIFDSCHSGSGTRARRKVRGLAKNRGQPIPKDLDRDIWKTASGFRGSSTAPGYTRRGLANHVLLAACTQKEEAADGVEGGDFTRALLPTLKSAGAASGKLHIHLGRLGNFDKCKSGESELKWPSDGHLAM
ncbi:hypothetical protein K443DRAFT_96311 [Laccaria amethystina LaAM-08-1]|uniref:Peptidase C14 caspase domain-containing protein n=1 Tax=Laccaria amethystina LaAM-08-1 TaxID=1095629 RepID=A0A0C9WUC0_9AGAR|nr:hypothetical protein K443DRAFT_96311 [Laccaria amethystina LaAM-08-1]